jgi:hypothetical protein
MRKELRLLLKELHEDHIAWFREITEAGPGTGCESAERAKMVARIDSMVQQANAKYLVRHDSNAEQPGSAIRELSGMYLIEFLGHVREWMESGDDHDFHKCLAVARESAYLVPDLGGDDYLSTCFWMAVMQSNTALVHSTLRAIAVSLARRSTNTEGRFLPCLLAASEIPAFATVDDELTLTLLTRQAEMWKSDRAKRLRFGDDSSG